VEKYLLSLLAILPVAASLALAQQPCGDLVRLTLPDVVIQSATAIPAGDFHLSTAPAGAPPVKVHAFCRVVGLVKPELQFELWLPSEWNGKYVAVGNGGMAGAVPQSALVAPVNRGYAAGGTDTGHEAANDDGAWALGHLNRLVNYAYRGVHMMTQADKAIVQAHYGAAPAHSYFNGCSLGGKQALTEAQRYPKDFDGIIAGDPNNSYTRHYIGGHLFDAMAVDGDGYIPASKVPLIGDAVNAACDELDGIKDGVLNDPRRCHFDPAVLQCKSGDAPNCLTGAQVSAVKKVWGGLKDANGQQIYPGLMPGGEGSAWLRYFSGSGPGKGRHAVLANTFFRDMVFEDPQWDYHNFRFTSPPGFDNDVTGTEDRVSSILDATDPDLRPFRANGGKLIQYHGWSDPDVPPLNSVNYYESVVAAMSDHSGGSAEDVAEFYRLFMVPGMEHCTGGPGTSQFDPLTALEQWVEQNKAPDQILAAHMSGGHVVRTRPLCPYPREAKYKGTGSTDEAANFVCAAP
jgi:feruloyl esterase